MPSLTVGQKVKVLNWMSALNIQNNGEPVPIPPANRPGRDAQFVVEFTNGNLPSAPGSTYRNNTIIKHAATGIRYYVNSGDTSIVSEVSYDVIVRMDGEPTRTSTFELRANALEFFRNEVDENIWEDLLSVELVKKATDRSPEIVAKFVQPGR